MGHGLFVGLITLDLVYRVSHPPSTNQKIVASDYIVAAGGPATNAAIAFHHLSQIHPPSHSSPVPTTTILGVLGCHPMAQLVRTEVEQWGVAIADLDPTYPQPVPTSSIMVTESTGDRAVVSLNAIKCQATPQQIPKPIFDSLWPDIGVVLIDGHQMAVGRAIAMQAKRDRIPVVVDAGSWKPHFDQVLRYADYVICSANFHPPECTTSEDVFQYLRQLGVPHIVITHGAEPIEYWQPCDSLPFGAGTSPSTPSGVTIPIPKIQPVDTLGAGDIFHGAFCHYLLHALPQRTQNVLTSSHSVDVIEPLVNAAHIASHACEYFGPRAWMQVSP
ncbi:MAG: sugar kinase [Merismopedia sp. SIO2A8]|nr:sugar kinase [Merismopedia sp. SIO2A8]